MKCVGHTSAGSPCKKYAIAGGEVCTKHGGTAPQVKAKAAERVLEQRARQLIPDEITIHPDPITRLLELAAEMDAFRGGVVDLVKDLNGKIRYSTDGGEQTRAEVLVYERALERAGRAYLDICKLGLEERLVRVRESEARALAAALDKALADAGLDRDTALSVKQHTARHLRAVSDAA